jgi:phosphoglycolate phosphatase
MPGAILFDFDYTLVDSSAGVIECMNWSLRQLGHPPATSDKICPTIGMPLDAAFQALAGASPLSERQRFVRCYLERADQVMNDLTVMLPLVRETLLELSARQIRMGIASTKRRRPIEEYLDRAGIRSIFHALVGGDDVKAAKPDPECVRQALDIFETEPDWAYFVGDSVIDAQTARNAGLPFVGVLSGTTTAAALSQYPCAAILNRLDELVEFCARRDTRASWNLSSDS